MQQLLPCVTATASIPETVSKLLLVFSERLVALASTASGGGVGGAGLVEREGEGKGANEGIVDKKAGSRKSKVSHLREVSHLTEVVKGSRKSKVSHLRQVVKVPRVHAEDENQSLLLSTLSSAAGNRSGRGEGNGSGDWWS